MNERLQRNQVPVESTWDLNALFPNDEAYYQAITNFEASLSKLDDYKGSLTQSAKQLYDGIECYENLIIEIYSIITYATLNQSTDATDVTNQEKAQRYKAVMANFDASTTFYMDEISELSIDRFNELLGDYPELEVYKPYITEIIDNKKYKLSEETEQALAAMGEVTSAPYTIYSVSKAADMQFDSIKDGEGNEVPNSFALFEGKYEYSEDGVLRKNAYESFNKTLKNYLNTYATVYATQVKKEVTLSRLRGYESVTEMLLNDQQVTLEMYNRQIDVIYNELAPHMRNFAKLLKKEIGVETLHFYDLKAPIDNTYNPDADYDEVKKTIKEALAVMGQDYVNIIDEALENRWIDYADNVGKSTGAFCASPYAAHPYILVTFQNNMRDAFTLIHELGHAAHFYLANKEQRYLNTRPSRYTVEAPSTMNEMLLGRYLLQNNDDPKMKKWVILQFLGTYYHNFVTHLLEAAFQRKVYALAEEGAPLTAQLLCNTKLEVLRGFWGDAVEIDDDAGMTWMRQPHYYMGLYPYTYSAGLTASTTCSGMIYEEGQPAVNRWLDMLKTGGKVKPLELLKIAGMDLSTDEPVQKAVAYVGTLIDDLTELCK